MVWLPSFQYLLILMFRTIFSGKIVLPPFKIPVLTFLPIALITLYVRRRGEYYDPCGSGFKPPCGRPMAQPLVVSDATVMLY